jgi:hypothetical protein
MPCRKAVSVRLPDRVFEATRSTLQAAWPSPDAAAETYSRAMVCALVISDSLREPATTAAPAIAMTQLAVIKNLFEIEK